MRNWYSAGIKTLGDFWNFRTKDFKNKRELGNIRLLTDFQYSKVIQATSRFKDILKNANPDQVINEPFIKTKLKTIPLNKLSSKSFYNILVDSVNCTPTHEQRIQSWFNKIIDWDFVYEVPHTITRNAYSLQVQFKITHNILPTQEKLYQWKIEQRPHCICGIVDTNLHHIVQCKLVKPFWQKIFDFIKTTLRVSFPISDFELFFGIKNELNDMMIDSINFILLTAKVYIWKEKR